MITVKLHSGLGNQMFMIAAVIGYANKYGVQYCIPPATMDQSRWKSYSFSNIRYCSGGARTMTQYKEPFFHYEEIPYHTYMVQLDGYFQSERYFEDCKDKILHAFKEIVPSDYDTSTDVGIHIRRGDYLLPQEKIIRPVSSGENEPSEYINNAINYFRKIKGCTRFKVFTDDKEWCRQHLNSDNFWFCDFVISENDNELDDLKDMARMKNHIIANSSFSWWAAWIAEHALPHKDRVVIAPKQWLNPVWMIRNNIDSKDVIPDRWVKM